MRPAVIDLSHHNTVNVSLKDAYAFGVRGVVHKLTEGTTFVDPKAKARFSLAKDAGLLWGLYHFLRPGKIEEQVQHFIESSVGVWDGNTVVACDYEDPAIPLSDVQKFMEACEKEFETQPVLYSGHVLKEKLTTDNHPLTKYRLWLAQYSKTPTLPKGWADYWLWQYTETGTVPGVSGKVDCNHYQGTNDELAADWGDLANTKWKTPASIEDRVTSLEKRVDALEKT